MKTVNEHLLEQLRKEKKAIAECNLMYRCNRRRINFLLRINQSHGRNHLLTWDEMDSGRILDTLH